MKKNPNIVNQVIKEYKKGILSSVLAKKYNVSSTSIRNWLKSKNVQRRPKSYYKKYHFNYNFFDSIDTEEKAYFLGFLYADGCYYKRYNKIVIELNIKDIKILEKFKKNLKSTYPLTVTKKKLKNGSYNKYVTFYVHDEHFSKRCEELGIKERKSLILEFPTEEQVPNHLINHFIRGYFDGDGSVSLDLKKRRVYGNIVSTKNFVTKIKEIIKIQTNQEIGYIIKDRNLYKFTYSCCFASKILFDFLYKNSTISLDRKRKIVKQFYKKIKGLQRRKGTKSKYFGVSVDRNRFITCIWDKVNKKSITIFSTENEIEAAQKYDEYCIKHQINLHKLNFS